MSKVIELSNVKRDLFRAGIKDLYSDVLSFGVSSYQRLKRKAFSESEIRARIMFFRKVKGRFLRLFREKNGLSIEEVARAIGWRAEDLEKIETGEWPVSDPVFYKLCEYLGALDHVLMFLDKIEDALKPHSHHVRVELVRMLRKEGVNPVLPEELAEVLGGNVVEFSGKKNERGGD